jgi:hypothetical protein
LSEASFDAPGTSADAQSDAIGSELETSSEAIDAGADTGADSPMNTGAEAGALYLCGSKAGPAPGDAGVTTLLADLGHQSNITGLWRSGDRVLSGETAGGWILWDVASGSQIVGSMLGTPLGLAGGTIATQQPQQAEIRSVGDGSLLGTIPAGTYTTFGLTADGSYVWGVSSTALTVWSASGVQRMTHSGNYSAACTSRGSIDDGAPCRGIFAAPTEIRVANGPAGSSVIEEVSPSDGTATTSPAFSGTFERWFADGASFVTTIGSNVFVYSQAAQKLQLFNISPHPNTNTIGTFGGVGSYLWNYQGGAIGYPVDIYKVGGNGQSIAQYPGNFSNPPVASGEYLGILDYGSPSATLIHLGPQQITDQKVMLPFPYLGAFAGDANGLWVMGNWAGALHYNGTTMSPSQAGPLGCGQASALGGSASGTAAAATAAGDLFVVDVPSGVFQRDLGFAAGRLQLSSDGKTLAASASADQALSTLPTALNVFDVPTGAAKYTFSFHPQTTSQPQLFGFTMSLGATLLARTIGSYGTVYSGAWAYNELITDLSGNTTVIMDNEGATQPNALLSPNGKFVAIADNGRPGSSRLYANGSLVNAIPGVAVGWVDDGHLLVQTFVHCNCSFNFWNFAGMKMYDNQGNLLASSGLPAVTSFETISSSRIYSHDDGKIYDVMTGAAVEDPGLHPGPCGGTFCSQPRSGTIAGGYVLSVVGRSLLAAPY